jgi:uncharacterized protein (DUF2141 family)
MEVTPLPILTSLCYNRPFLDDDFDVITDAPTPAATNAPTQTTCNDGEQDDDETDVDCGGATCKGCDEGLKCNLDADCAGDAIKCDGGTCKKGPTNAPTPSPTPTPTACMGEVKVTSSDFTSANAIIWLYDNADSWGKAKDRCNDDAAYIHLKKAIAPPTGSYALKVPAGDYALMLIDDKNNNGKLDANWMGVPTEGCGASNGAKGGPMGGPSWGDAVFSVVCNQVANVEIELWHM